MKPRRSIFRNFREPEIDISLSKSEFRPTYYTRGKEVSEQAAVQSSLFALNVSHVTFGVSSQYPPIQPAMIIVSF